VSKLVPQTEKIADNVPWSDAITPYDEAHFVTYLRLLDASAAGVSDEEMCRVVLQIDPAKEAQRAASALKSHLVRARWMTTHGYRHLLES
jgi:Uncharacterized conserved protein (DUF2285)